MSTYQCSKACSRTEIRALGYLCKSRARQRVDSWAIRPAVVARVLEVDLTTAIWVGIAVAMGHWITAEQQPLRCCAASRVWGAKDGDG